MNRLQRMICSAGAAILLGTLAGPASATLAINAGVGYAPTGVIYVTFDNLPLGAAGGIDNGITVSFGGNGAVVQGQVPGAAPPYLSNNNGLYFNGAADGVDTTRYLTSGNTYIKFVMPSPQQYFGLLWGSVDSYNTLQFWSGTDVVGSITGSDIAANASGNQGVNGTYYVNINSTLPFDTIYAGSSSTSFEIDNVAYFVRPQDPGPAPDPDPVIPEPATLALLGLGLSGLGMVRRRHPLGR